MDNSHWITGSVTIISPQLLKSLLPIYRLGIFNCTLELSSSQDSREPRPESEPLVGASKAMVVGRWAIDCRNLRVVHSKVHCQLATVMSEKAEVFHDERVAWILQCNLSVFE
jgi:hypothetical protein